MLTATYSFAYFSESLQYQYLQRALLSTIIVGIVCGIIGVFIVLKGMSFLGAGIAHSCFAGGALAILLGIDPFITIFLFGEGSAIIISYVNERETTANKDTAVGIMFSFTMALAILFIGLLDGFYPSVNALLFGNALTVSDESLWRLAIVSAIIMIIFFAIKKELFFIVFDEEMAKVSGIPVRILNYVFIALVAGIITVSLKAIGAILVFAMIVIPAAAAYQWSYKVNTMLVLAAIFGAFSSALGLVLSFMYNLPTGSTIVMLVTAIFILSMMLSPKRRGFQHTSQSDQEEHAKTCKYCMDFEENISCDFCEDPDDEDDPDCNHAHQKEDDPDCNQGNHNNHNHDGHNPHEHNHKSTEEGDH